MAAQTEVAMPMVRALLAALRRKGVDTAEFLQELGIDADAVNDTRYRVSLPVYDRLQESAMAVLNDPALGLHMGEQTLPVTLGVMGHLLLGAPTIAQGIDVFLRYQKLLNNAEPSTLSVEGERAVFVYRFPRSTATCNRIRSEFGMVQIVRIGQTLMSGALTAQSFDITLFFEHPAPDYVEEYQRVFGCKLHFSQPETRLEFPASILHDPVPQPDPLVIRLLEEEARRQIAWLECETPLTERVEHLLFTGLQAGKPTIGDVAAQLGLNERTLRRKLEHEQTSYSVLLGKVQFRLAEKWLASPALSVEEIANRLQFSEPSAFYRAFRRWTGKTPAEYREHHGLPPK